MRHHLVAVVLGAAILATPATARACNDCGPSASGGVTDSGGEVVVGNVDHTDGGGSSPTPAPLSSGGGSAQRVVCQIYDAERARANRGEVADPLDPGTVTGGTVVWQVCFDPVTNEALYSGAVTWAGGQAAPLIPPRVLAERARAQLQLPRPQPRTWPAPEDQVVRVPVWLHVDNFESASATATAGPVSATVSAAPVSVEWSFGDGQSVTCADAGAELRAGPSVSACTHTFERTSARQPGEVFAGSVSITWHLRWDSNLGDRGDLGLVVQSTPVTWRVEQIQSVITGEGTR